MKNFTRLFFTGFFLLLFSGMGMAQLNPTVTSVVGKLVRITPKLADIDKTSMYGEPFKITRDMNGIIGISDRGEEKVEEQIRRNSKNRTSAAVQSPNNIFPNTPGTTLGVHFDGQGWAGFDPSDNNLAVGPNHVIQIINNNSGSIFKIWDKTGAVVQNGTILTSITGLQGAGDPIVLYDQLADRWLMAEFGPSTCCNQLIIAVSVTANPTGAWKIYQYIDASFFPDYPKFSVWHNAYYGTTNDFNAAGTTYLGSSVYAFDRTAMLAGAATATMVRFRQTNGAQDYYNMGTVCLEGTTTSAQNGLFIFPSGGNLLNIFELTPNFANPPASIVGAVTSLPIAAYAAPPSGVAQQGSGQTIQTLGQRMMFRMNYRNNSGTESIVATHSVGVGGLAAVRWYELRRVAGAWTIYQQGTLANPDGNSRWMGGIAMDANGNIGLAYDLSGTTAFPSIKYTARNACDPLGSMTLPEQTIVNGTGAHTSSSRWGDYNTLVNDPSTPGSFWGTSEYSVHSTHVFNFSITSACNAALITPGTATITSESCSPANGVVDPNETVTVSLCLQNTGALNTTNLVATLQPTGGVTVPSAPQNYGVVVSGGAAVCRNFTFTANTTCGSTVVATLQLQDGATNLGTITYNFVTGVLSTTFTQNFDGVAAPALPAGWVATNLQGAAPLWVTSSASNNSAPNSIFVDDPSSISDKIIETPSIAIATSSAVLSFKNKYALESGFDGGVLEISINGGAYADIVTAGGVFTAGGYTGTISGSFGNPLAGRSAWTGTTGSYITSTVTLPAGAAGQNVKFRFRMGSDNSVSNPGWNIDDVTISERACCLGCTPPSVATQPVSVTVCPTATATFSVVAGGSSPFTYQWQESTGGPFAALANGGVYSGVTTANLTLTGVTAGMNGYQYRCVITGNCGSPATSNAATLSTSGTSVGGTVTPANTIVCTTPNNGTLTVAGFTGSIVRWEFSTVSNVGPWTTIANTTTTQTYTNITVTTWYRAVVQVAGCAVANSSVAAVTVGATNLSISADNGTTLCAGDPTLLSANDGGASPTPVTMVNTPTSVNGAITFNFRNNNAFAVTITDIASVVNLAGANVVSAWYKPSPINGAPGPITPANGWNQFGTANINALGFPNVEKFMYGLNLNIPAGATYGIVINAILPAGAGNMVYNNPALSASPTIASAGGCDIISGANIGYSGLPVPAAPATTVRIFTGSVTFKSTVPGTPVVGGTFLWSPAAGLNSTTTNPVSASPATTTTYTVTHNNGSGCIRTASILISINQRPKVTTQPVSVINCSGTTATFTVAGTGAVLTYQWQVSTNNGVSYADLANLAPYSGVTTTTLTINPVTTALNGNLYRCVLSGTCPPPLFNPLNISNGALLTVNPLPTVVITPAGPVCGGLPNVSGTQLTVSGTGTTYTWSPAAGLYSDANASIPYVAGTSATTVYAAPTTNTTYTVTGTITATNCTNTGTVTVNYQPVKPTVSPTSVTMCLGDAAAALTITSSLAPATQTFSSSGVNNNVTIPDGPTIPPVPATYPATTSTIPVALPVGAVISSMSVKLNATAIALSDLVIALKAPNGSVLNLDASLSKTWDVQVNFVNTVISSTGTVALGAGVSPGITGTFKPDAEGATFTMFGFTFPGGPTGFIPNVSNFSGLYSTPNGNWTLGIYDNSVGNNGGGLAVLNNWSIDITYGVPSVGIWSPNAGLYLDAAATTPYTGTAVGTVYAKPAVSTNYSVTINTGSCTSLPTVIPVTVNNPVTVTNPVNSTLCTDKVTSFSVTATGTSPTYQWQVSTNGGVSFANISNGGVYSGATTATLTITAPPTSLNGNQYRCVVSGAAPCGSVTSGAATLTVNPLPTVAITANPRKLWPGLRTTITSTSTPTAATYTWSRNGTTLTALSAGIISGINTGSLLIDVDGLGDYRLRVTDVNGCTNNSNILTISDSTSGHVFIYPNPNSGRFQVRYDPMLNNILPRGINVYNGTGQRIATLSYTLGLPYARMDVDLRTYGAGVYWIEVVDVNQERLAMGRVEVLR